MTAATETVAAPRRSPGESAARTHTTAQQPSRPPHPAPLTRLADRRSVGEGVGCPASAPRFRELASGEVGRRRTGHSARPYAEAVSWGDSFADDRFRLRVVECGSGVSAAYAAKLMADVGADVIKVELPAG